MAQGTSAWHGQALASRTAPTCPPYGFANTVEPRFVQQSVLYCPLPEGGYAEVAHVQSSVGSSWISSIRFSKKSLTTAYCLYHNHTRLENQTVPPSTAFTTKRPIMKRICMITALACALLFSACEDSRQERQEREQEREEMARMRAELDALKQREAERTAREAQARAEDEQRNQEASETPERESGRHAPRLDRINRETDLSVDDIIMQLKKYAGLGEILVLPANPLVDPVVRGGDLLEHYSMMKDGLETIKDWPFLAAITQMAFSGPPALPKEKYIKTLLNAGASTAGKYNGRTALSCAAGKGAATCVKLLLDAGADPNEADGVALESAAVCGDAQCVELLLKAGADVNHQDSVHGETALHCACEYGNASCVKVLMEAGADPSIQAKGEITPLDVAKLGWYSDCIELLKKKATPSPK